MHTLIIFGAAGEWNTIEKTAASREHPGLKNKSGAIGFLGHGDVLHFQDIRVKALDYNNGEWKVENEK